MQVCPVRLYRYLTAQGSHQRLKSGQPSACQAVHSGSKLCLSRERGEFPLFSQRHEMDLQQPWSVIYWNTCFSLYELGEDLGVCPDQNYTAPHLSICCSCFSLPPSSKKEGRKERRREKKEEGRKMGRGRKGRERKESKRKQARKLPVYHSELPEGR